MSDVITSNTHLTASKMEVIAAAAQKSLAFSTKLLPTVTDYSFMVGKGMKSLTLPKLNEFNVTNRVSGQAVSASALTVTGDDLLLNKVPHVNFIIDPQDAVQSTLDVQTEFAVRAAAAQGRYVDSQIVTEAFLSGEIIGSPGNISKNWILAAREYLAGNNADLAQTVIVVGTDQERILLDIADFVRYDYTGLAVGQNPIVSGTIGRIYGTPVVVSNAMATGSYAMWEKSGLAIAFQRQPVIGRQPEVAYGPTAEKWAIEAHFGVKALQIEVGNASADKSALVAISAASGEE